MNEEKLRELHKVRGALGGRQRHAVYEYRFVRNLANIPATKDSNLREAGCLTVKQRRLAISSKWP